MSEHDLPAADAPAEATWSKKVVKLHQALAQRNVPYAFGGAIALNYHREPRSTLDIDINVFLSPHDQAEVVSALHSVYDVADEDRISADLNGQGQTRTLWGGTYVDLFFANTDFHASMAQRVVHEPFADTTVPVLSIEDLLICKLLFDRPKDWIDIEAVVQARGDQLDHRYIQHWMHEFVPGDDARFSRLRELLKRLD